MMAIHPVRPGKMSKNHKGPTLQCKVVEKGEET